MLKTSDFSYYNQNKYIEEQILLSASFCRRYEQTAKEKNSYLKLPEVVLGFSCQFL